MVAEPVEAASILIYNNPGQLVKKEELNYKEGRASLNISELNNGVYFINLTNADKASGTKKLIISK